MSMIELSPTGLDDQETINFQTANVLILEQGGFGLEILRQTLAGFGTRNCYKSLSVEQAKGIARQNTLDLVIVDPNLATEDGHDFVRWLRRSGLDPNRSTPLIIASANGTKSAVAKARDAGANFFLVKPVRPGVLLERILRVTREKRAFIITESYAGPDRRFKNVGPPEHIGPRRASDFEVAPPSYEASTEKAEP